MIPGEQLKAGGCRRRYLGGGDRGQGSHIGLHCRQLSLHLLNVRLCERLRQRCVDLVLRGKEAAHVDLLLAVHKGGTAEGWVLRSTGAVEQAGEVQEGVQVYVRGY
jgi:hypothetical protein